MDSPPFMIAGDVDIPPEVTQIKLITPLSRYDFATIALNEEDKETLLVRRVDLAELATFDGILFQADSLEEEDSVVLREVSLAFWPYEEEEDEEEDEADDDDEDEETEEDEAVSERSFRVVTPDWWKDFVAEHRRE